MLKFTSIVRYTSCGPTYIESFLTIFGQCINVLNYKGIYQSDEPENQRKERKKGKRARMREKRLATVLVFSANQALNNPA